MITLTNSQLAEIIGKEISNNYVDWKREDLSMINIALRALRLTAGEDSFLIDAEMPYWLYLCILASLAPKKVMLNTPNFGPVAIPQNTAEGSGQGITFKIYEDSECTLVECSSPRTLQVEQLSSIVPPAVNPNKGVVISTRAPYWVVGTVALAYAKSASWVACTQPNGTAVVAISNTKARVLGTEIEKLSVDGLLQKASQTAIPKRGQIWLFEDGYGQHPGLIISPTALNEQTNQALVVPFTTSSMHSHRHFSLTPQQTGLPKHSYAKCSNICKIEWEQLVKGPVGEVGQDLLQDIVRQVRLAIGDTAA